MPSKCSLTGEPCRIGFDYGTDNCPIGRYKDSSYYYGPGESKTGAHGRMDNTCRYYGIARAARLKNKNFMED